MKNRKGFTLIELVAVIVIIGILVVLIVPSVSNYMVNTRNSTYMSHEKAMSEAAESYTIDCISSNGKDCEIPLPNEEKEVYLSELIDKDFLSKLGDPAKNNSFCNPNTSYVKVTNTGDNDFEYVACLYCSSYSTENPVCVTYNGDSDNPVCVTLETHSEWTNGSRQVKVGCQDATSGCLRNEFKKTFSTTTNKGIITITDKSGNSTDCEVEVKVDKNLPTCEIVTTDTPINDWYPYGSKFTITSMQDGESGLLTYGMGTSVEPDFNKQREYVPVQGITRVFGYVKDNAGNVGTCSINAKVKTRFTVRYDKNNGTGSMPDKICMVDDNCDLDENTFTRVGYTFEGWNTRSDGSGTSYADKASVKNIVFSGGVTLYAQWKVITYNITYTLNGGSATNPATYTIESDDITLNNPTMAHYVFTGWTGTDLTSATMTVTIPNGSIGDREYTANWTASPKAVITCENKYYNGSAQTIATCSGGTIANETQTNAGDYSITCAGDFDHSDADAATCSVYKVNATIACDNKYYNGSAQTIASCSGGTVGNASQINAGDYAISCTGDSNHNNADAATCSIYKVNATIACDNKNFTGSAQTIASCSGGTVAGESQTNAGNYTITCTGDNNHNDATPATCSINKVNATIACANKTYSGGWQTIATCTGGTVGNAWQAYVGDYTITCAGDGNHNNAANATCSISCPSGKVANGYGGCKNSVTCSWVGSSGRSGYCRGSGCSLLDHPGRSCSSESDEGNSRINYVSGGRYGSCASDHGGAAYRSKAECERKIGVGNCCAGSYKSISVCECS